MAIDPLVFAPYLRPQVWGGRRLESLFGKKLPRQEPYGESWEISGHCHHVSVVAEGAHEGKTLLQMCQEHGSELFGKSAGGRASFPLLIKLLDCHHLLSIQVHPSDDLASQLLGEDFGKTEAWVVLDVEADGRIYAGLQEGVGLSELERHLASGTLEQCLHSFVPKRGDCLLLRSGTVHAVGGGVVIAEVQQSSDATFRLHDWNRLGSDGKPRQLHIEESLKSIDFDAGPCQPQSPIAMAGLGEGVRGEELARCRYFQMERYWLSGSMMAPAPGEWSIWMTLEGSVELVGERYQRRFDAGSTVLLPAKREELQWRNVGSSRDSCLLKVTLPD